MLHIRRRGRRAGYEAATAASADVDRRARERRILIDDAGPKQVVHTPREGGQVYFGVVFVTFPTGIFLVWVGG